MSQADIRGEVFIESIDSPCKGPEVGVDLKCSTYSQEKMRARGKGEVRGQIREALSHKKDFDSLFCVKWEPLADFQLGLMFSHLYFKNHRSGCWIEKRLCSGKGKGSRETRKEAVATI